MTAVRCLASASFLNMLQGSISPRRGRLITYLNTLSLDSVQTMDAFFLMLLVSDSGYTVTIIFDGCL